jgi:hypothetical protein
MSNVNFGGRHAVCPQLTVAWQDQWLLSERFLSFLETNLLADADFLIYLIFIFNFYKNIYTSELVQMYYTLLQSMSKAN